MTGLARWMVVLTALAGCGGSSAEVGPADDPSSPPSTLVSTPPAASAPPPASGAKVAIHVLAIADAAAPLDGAAAQTPSAQSMGIRKLVLLRSASDGAPLVAFDHGASAIEAGLDAGDDTLVADVPLSTLSAGRFTIARVVVSHVRYRVAATMHAQGQAVPGVFDNLQVLSDGSLVDGQSWNRGHYRFTFEAGGAPLATQTGENGPLPIARSGGGLEMQTSGSETAYVFPVDLVVDPTNVDDVKLTFEIDTKDDFRWQDQAAAGYAPGVFDTTPASFEPVTSFGANAFRLR